MYATQDVKAGMTASAQAQGQEERAGGPRQTPWNHYAIQSSAKQRTSAQRRDRQTCYSSPILGQQSTRPGPKARTPHRPPLSLLTIL